MRWTPAHSIINSLLKKICAPFFFAAILSITGCATSEKEKAKPQEAPPNQNALLAQPQPSALPPSAQPPPKVTEVQDAVKRVFKEAATLDDTRPANFAVGDFNGDQSQDIAVVLKPVADRLSDLNEAAPPWILRDPFSNRLPGSVPLRITADESILAIIHGYGPLGWRDPQATQTFLLKNATGPGVEMHPKTAFIAANRGKKTPQLRGDLIAEVLKGAPGYLYYDDSGYSWYDPKTFKEEPVKRMVHSGMSARK
ncbi:MAG: hypothetical protein QOK48_3667 [Blastocatellia bacterium]|nr:hypothetical protein [Blastocatellia bacterium]